MFAPGNLIARHLPNSLRDTYPIRGTFRLIGHYGQLLETAQEFRSKRNPVDEFWVDKSVFSLHCQLFLQRADLRKYPQSARRHCMCPEEGLEMPRLLGKLDIEPKNGDRRPLALQEDDDPRRAPPSWERYMTSNRSRRQRSRTSKRPPRRAPSLSPATMASCVTGVLVQVQVNAQGTHDLLPVLIAVLVLAIGACHPNEPET
jgi:hypothetical protein